MTGVFVLAVISPWKIQYGRYENCLISCIVVPLLKKLQVFDKLKGNRQGVMPWAKQRNSLSYSITLTPSVSLCGVRNNGFVGFSLVYL